MWDIWISFLEYHLWIVFCCDWPIFFSLSLEASLGYSVIWICSKQGFHSGDNVESRQHLTWLKTEGSYILKNAYGGDVLTALLVWRQIFKTEFMMCRKTVFQDWFSWGTNRRYLQSFYSSFWQLFRKKLSWAFSPGFGPWSSLYTFLASLIHSMHSSFIHLNSIHPLMSFYSVHRTEQAFGRVGKWLKLWFLYSRLTVVLEGSK